MKLLWIGAEANKPAEAAFTLPLQKVPSLVALAMVEAPQYDAVLLDCCAELAYSLPHILAAHAGFQRQGIPFYVLSPQSPELRKFSFFVSNILEAKKGLEEAADSFAKQASEKTSALLPPPLRLPAGLLPIIDVVGSQSRVGCTTQAICLYQALSELHLSPAVILPTEQLELISSVLSSIRQNGICLIEGIPFAAEMSISSDSFVRDLGVIHSGTASEVCDADISVLVCGTAPWELPQTAKALGLMQQARRLMLIASFTESQELSMLRSLLDKLGIQASVLAAPWHPDPFGPCNTALYLRYLAPLLHGLMQKENQ